MEYTSVVHQQCRQVDPWSADATKMRRKIPTGKLIVPVHETGTPRHAERTPG